MPIDIFVFSPRFVVFFREKHQQKRRKTKKTKKKKKGKSEKEGKRNGGTSVFSFPLRISLLSEYLSFANISPSAAAAETLAVLIHLFSLLTRLFQLSSTVSAVYSGNMNDCEEGRQPW